MVFLVIFGSIASSYRVEFLLFFSVSVYGNASNKIKYRIGCGKHNCYNYTHICNVDVAGVQFIPIPGVRKIAGRNKERLLIAGVGFEVCVCFPGTPSIKHKTKFLLFTTRENLPNIAGLNSYLNDTLEWFANSKLTVSLGLWKV